MKFFCHRSLFFLSLLLANSLCALAQQRPPDAIDAKVEALLKKMTLAEKVGQMNQYNGFWEVTGPVPSEGNAKKKYEHLSKGMVGSVLNVRGVENVRKLQEIAVKGSRLGIPLIFGSDVIHGYKTLFPIPLGEAASWDLGLIEKSARLAATEATAVGINWTFAPMVDITRDARWGRVMEGAGEDPYLGSLIGAARVKGFQGTDLSATNTLIACAKHFAGYGFAEAGREYNTVDVGTSTLYNVILPPFKMAVDSGVRTVMNSFNVLNGVPATGNEFLMRTILKGQWGFKGFVISDWGSGAEMVGHGFSENLEQVAMQAANAGSDMDMESYAFITHLQKLVETGKVNIKVVDDAVRRILRTKFELGLFDDPYKYCNEQREKNVVNSKPLMDEALEVAKHSIVLLKNEGQLLPLKKDQKKIAVIGALADDHNSPLGSWRIGSIDSTAVSVLDGLKNAGINYTYAKGAEVAIGQSSFRYDVQINETDKSGFKEAIDLAAASDLVIMVLGEHGFQTGEGRSRTKIDLPGVQEELLKEIYKVNPKIILVLMNGRPLTIPWAAEHVPAILETWQLGTQSGNAIAQVLNGSYNPSGKLPMSFPRTVGQVPIYYNHYSTGRGNEKPEVFWSHYSDEKNSPQFPFGFGLSYTKFDYQNLSIDASNNKKILVKATIRNSGAVAGEEVVQLYIHDRVASVVRPVKELKGFKKISLQPGQAMEVQFTLTPSELGFYNNNGVFVVEPGAFDILVGTNSEEGLKGSFMLK